MPIDMVSGMVMPISMHCEIVDAGRTTDPVELLKKDEKHVPFQITDKQRPSSGHRRSRIMCRCNRAAVRRLWILSGRGKGDQAAGTKWTAGVHKTKNDFFCGADNALSLSARSLGAPWRASALRLS